MAEDINPKNNGTKVLFTNPILEKLSRTHISIPLIIFGMYATTLLYWSATHTSLSTNLIVLYFFLGVFAFTLVEYLMHRYVFHMDTYTKAKEKLQYTIHGVHHEFPKDKERLAMPPLLSITISTVLLLIFRVVMGDVTFAFLPGFLVGYAAYISVHYMIHAYQPPKSFLKILWVNHSIHHYKDGHVVFGVSSPLWDYIFGTMSEKARTDSKAH